MKKRADSTDELLQKLLIVQMRVAGVPVDDIAKVVGKRAGDVRKVAKLVRIKE